MLLDDNQPVLLPANATLEEVWIDGKGRLRGVVVYESASEHTMEISAITPIP